MDAPLPVLMATSEAAEPGGEGGGVYGDAALDAAFDHHREEHAAKVRGLLRDARAAAAAMAGWSGIETPEDWQRLCEAAWAAYRDGSFLIKQLGARRYVDPETTAVLLLVRQRLLRESDAATAAEEMLVDLAVLSYANALRVQGWLGDAALLLEADLFGASGPTARLAARYGEGSVVGLEAEEWVARLAQQLVPLLDRVNRQLIRNLRALREAKGAAPAVTVTNVGQLNVGHTQTNTAGPQPRRGRGRAREGAPP